MNELNATMGINSFSVMSSTLPPFVVGVIVFLLAILILFILFRYIRFTIYGAIVLTPLLLIYKFASWTSIKYSEGNIKPFKYTLLVSFFIVLSFVIGYYLSHTKFVKNIEKKLK